MFLHILHEQEHFQNLGAYNVQMYRYSTTSQVVHAHDAADDIPPQIVKDEDFPYGRSILYDGHSFGKEAIRIVFQVGARSVIRELLELDQSHWTYFAAGSWLRLRIFSMDAIRLQVSAVSSEIRNVASTTDLLVVHGASVNGTW